MSKKIRNSSNSRPSLNVPGSKDDGDLQNAVIWTEAFNKTLLNSRHFPCIATDQAGFIHIFNPGAENMFGFTADEMVNKANLIDILDPVEVIARARALNQEYDTRIKQDFEAIIGKVSHEIDDAFEMTFIHKNSDPIPVIVSVSALQDDQDKIIGYLLICTDNTVGKRTEEKLHESEARFRTLFEQAAVGVALLETRTGRYIDINQKYCDFLGYSREEMMNSNFQSVTHFEDVQENVDYNAMLITRQFKEFSIDKRYVRKDGSIVWGNLTVSPLWAPDEEPKEYYHIAVVLDINDRKLTEIKSEYLSMHDALTGLYNRAYFTESLDRLEQGRVYPISIMMADVDKLKETNDRDGHAAGDELLKRTALVLKDTFRVEDIIARIGGDEFCVLLPGISISKANDFMDRFFSILKAHNLAHFGTPLQISCGISTAEEGDSLIETFKKADARMYENKKSQHANT